MRKQSWDQRRDVAVRLLARLSLVAALAVLGALFVGGAATSQASESEIAAADSYGSSPEQGLEQASPGVLVVGAVVIGGGIVVLLIGAFRPPTSSERRNYADLSYR